MSNQELAEKNYLKAFGKIIEKQKVYSFFKDNIWGADVADMQLLSKFNKGIRFSLCVVDFYSKYLRVVPLKGKKVIITTNVLQKYLGESNGKPNKI